MGNQGTAAAAERGSLGSKIETAAKILVFIERIGSHMTGQTGHHNEGNRQGIEGSRQVPSQHQRWRQARHGQQQEAGAYHPEQFLVHIGHGNYPVYPR